MNKTFEKFKEKFLTNNELNYERICVSEEENKKLNDFAFFSPTAKEAKILNDYYKDVDERGRYFYKKVPADISDEEIKQYAIMKSLEVLKSMDKKLDTIKNIMIFWLVLSIISIIGSIYTAVKIAELTRGFLK